jgi:hypothetical protein
LCPSSISNTLVCIKIDSHHEEGEALIETDEQPLSLKARLFGMLCAILTGYASLYYWLGRCHGERR